jgi:hypothetical protein
MTMIHLLLPYLAISLILHPKLYSPDFPMKILTWYHLYPQ